MPRDRKGYDPHGLTIRRLIAEQWFVGESAQRMSVIGAMTIDRRPLLDEPYWMRSDSVHEVRSAPKTSELLLTAGALYALGERDVAFRICERPDLLAKLADGREVGIEVTEVVGADAAHRTNALLDVNIALRDAVDADPALWPRETYLAFNVSPLVDVRPSAKEREAMVQEILAILRDRSWHAYVGAMPATDRPSNPESMLDRFGMWLHVGELPGSERGMVQIFGSANAFDPGGLVAVADERIATKCDKARGYGVGIPLWLVLALTDQNGLFMQSVETIAARPPSIDPFARMIVTDSIVTRVVEGHVLRREVR